MVSLKKMDELVQRYRRSINPPYNFKDYLNLFFTFLILLGLPVAVYLAQQSQEIRQQAQEVVPRDNVRELTNELLKGPKQEEKLIEIASERKELMLRAAKENPDTFIANALPNKATRTWPQRVKELLEQQTTVNGKLKVIVFDNFENNSSTTDYKLSKYILRFAKGEAPNLGTGDKVTVSGYVLGDNLVVDMSSGTAIQAVSQPARTSNITERQTAVILFNFSDYRETKDSNGQEITAVDVTTNFFADAPATSVRSYYQEGSFGQTFFTGRVFGWVTIGYNLGENPGKCDYETWANLADSASGVTPTDYHHIFYIFPKVAACKNGAWATLQFLSGRKIKPIRAWSNGVNSPRTFVHELGHNLGLRHAAVLDCGNKAIDADQNCNVLPKEDLFDIMGNIEGALSHFNAPHKDIVSFLQNVQIVRKDGVYDIAPLELGAGSMPQALKIEKAKSKGKTFYYWVEYRQPIGFDDNSFIRIRVSEGVGITIYPVSKPDPPPIDPEKPDSDTHRLSFPEIATGATGQFTLTDGRSFWDEIAGIKIKQVSHDGTKAQVQVIFGPGQCVEQAPDVIVTTTDDSTFPGGTVTYQVTVTNRDSTACPPTIFTLSEIVPAGWVGTFSPPSLTLASGESGTSTWVVDSPEGITDGIYDVTVKVVDADNPILFDTETDQFIVSSLETPPSPTPIPSASPTPPTSGSGGRIAFAGRPSTTSIGDDIGIINPDGSGRIILNEGSSTSEQTPEWSPDASLIAFVRTVNGQNDIFVMNADGSGERNITNFSGGDNSPAWSPDGTKIVFTSNRNFATDLYVIDLGSAEVRRLTSTPGGDSMAAWSPDGTTIVFSYDGQGGIPPGIYKMPAQGTVGSDMSGATQITTNQSDRASDWSPDGLKIAFNRDVGTNVDIHVMNADGSGVIRLTTHSSADYFPSWSPDGSRLTFGSYRDNNEEIYVMNADGSNQVNITQTSTYHESHPSWGR